MRDEGTLGGFVRAARLKRDLTLTELGNKIGASAMGISAIENNKELPKGGRLLKSLADFFGIDVAILINLSDNTRVAMERENGKPQQALKLELARKIINSGHIDDSVLKKMLEIIEGGKIEL